MPDPAICMRAVVRWLERGSHEESVAALQALVHRRHTTASARLLPRVRSIAIHVAHGKRWSRRRDDVRADESVGTRTPLHPRVMQVLRLAILAAAASARSDLAATELPHWRAEGPA
jgi:hypothetical protein